MNSDHVTRAEYERVQEFLAALDKDNDRLRDALIPFAFIGREFMEPLGLAGEYDHARELLGLNEPTEVGKSADVPTKSASELQRGEETR